MYKNFRSSGKETLKNKLTAQKKTYGIDPRLGFKTEVDFNRQEFQRDLKVLILNELFNKKIENSNIITISRRKKNLISKYMRA